MFIDYRKWDQYGKVIECDGVKYVVAPEDLTLDDAGEKAREGYFSQDEAKKINSKLAASWTIPTYAQMCKIVEECSDVCTTGRSYWVDNADYAYSPVRNKSVPKFEIDTGMVSFRIRCICALSSVME